MYGTDRQTRRPTRPTQPIIDTPIPSYLSIYGTDISTHLDGPLLDLDEGLRDELGQHLRVLGGVGDGGRLADGVRLELC